MAKNVFISFRYSDGNRYKDHLCELFDKNYDTVDYSEDVDCSNYSETTIKNYLYAKLKRSSVTIILLTPNAVNHHKDRYGRYDDWMYDEIRYSLEDRVSNRTNGLIAVYAPEAKPYLIEDDSDSVIVKNVDNLFRVNMMNIKSEYKKCSTPGRYDRDYDSYCSLISYNEFIKNMAKYIDIATSKRDALYKFNIAKRL